MYDLVFDFGFEARQTFASAIAFTLLTGVNVVYLQEVNL